MKRQRNWEMTSLGRAAKFLSGGTPSKLERRYWGGDIPWIGSGEMKAARISHTALQVTEDGAKNGTRLVPSGTILVVVRGMSLAKEFRVSRPTVRATFNQDVKAILATDLYDSTFLFYYLKSQSTAIKDSASEAAHGTKKLDMAVLQQWPLPIISIDEQRKIAAVLTAYDDLIENNRQRIALLEKMAEEIYREWFVRLRFPGHEHTPIHKGVPERWQRRSIDDLSLMVKRGISPRYDENSEHTVLNQKCIRDHRVSFDQARFHVTSMSQDKLLRRHDVLINSTGVGTLGRAAIYNLETTKVTVDSHITT